MNTPHPHSDPLRYLRAFRERLARGEPLTAREYAATLQVSAGDELYVDLVFAEFLEREQRGEANAQEYILAAYPAFADELRLQIELHRSIQSCESIKPPDASAITRVGKPSRPRESNQPTTLPTLPGFDVLGPLGRGGMGVVYLAKELELDRLVAIKLLLGGDLSSLDHRRRFRAEARAAAALRHPNIVQVDDVGEIGDQPFIVMEYVAGGTMEEYLRRHRPNVRETASFIRKIAWAVHAAHQAGIVHRDLKPGNFLLAPRLEGSGNFQDGSVGGSTANRPEGSLEKSSLLSDYEPKITDFGLAKTLQPLEVDHAAVTVKGDVLGTPCYMSPEQIRGDTVGPEADIYSLGSILYEMLSGKPPFQRPTPWETLQCVLEQEPPPLASKLPADLRTICEKCLRKDPIQRYSSMAALAVDLGNYLEGRPIDARPVGNLTRLVRWAKRNVAIASSLVAVFLTLSTLLVVSLWSRWSLQEMLDQSIASKRQETIALGALREQLWENMLSEAQSIQTSNRIGQRYRSLDNVREAIKMLPIIGETPERLQKLRNTAIAALPLVDVQNVQIGKLAANNQHFLSADAQFQRFALLQPDSSIHIVEPAAQALLYAIPPEEANSVVISPDGRSFILNGSQCVLRTFSDVSLKRVLGEGVNWSVFSPDSRWIAGYDARGLLVHDIQRNQTQRVEEIPVASMPMSFSPDGNRLALVSGDRLIIVTLQPQVDWIELPGPTLSQMGNTLAWHPNGDYLAAGLYSDRIVTVWHLPTRRSAKNFRVSGVFHNLHFDSTGQFLIKASLWGGSREIYAFETQVSLMQLPNSVGLAFGLDDSGSPLTLSNPIDGSLDAWRIENQLVTRILEPAQLNSGQRSHCLLSACGRWLFVNSEQGVEIYDALESKPAGCLPIGALAHVGVSSLEDGGFAVLMRDRVQQWSLGSGGLQGPKTIRLPDGLEIIEVSADRRWGLCTDYAGVHLLDFTGTEPLRFLGPQADVRSAAFDLVYGRVATASWNIADGVVVWNLATGREEKRLSLDRQCVVRFSPNGKFLFTSAGGGSLWDADSWKEWRLDSPDASSTGFGFAYSLDSRWFVHTSGNGVLKLQDLERRSTLAALSDPDQHHYFSLAFSADNSSLFGVTIGRDCFIKRWDFERIDQQLTQLQLPKLSLASSNKSMEPIPYGSRLRVPSSPELNQLVEEYVRARVQRAFDEKRWESGLAELRSAVVDVPENGELLTDLAWRLVTVPQEFCDPHEASIAIEKALPNIDSERTSLVHAFVLSQTEEFEEALMVLSKISTGDGDIGMLAKYLSARLLSELGRDEEAQQAFLNAQKLKTQERHDTTDLPFEEWDHFLWTVRQAVFKEGVASEH